MPAASVQSPTVTQASPQMKIILDIWVNFTQMINRLVPGEGRSPRDAARRERDAVLAGGVRNLAPERPPEERCGVLGPASSGHRETRKRTDTASGAPEDADASV